MTMINIHDGCNHEQPQHRRHFHFMAHLMIPSCNGLSALAPRPRSSDDHLKEAAAAAAAAATTTTEECVLVAPPRNNNIEADRKLRFTGGVTQKLYRRILKEESRLLKESQLQEGENRDSCYELESEEEAANVDFHLATEASAKHMANLCVVASKLCYEDEDVIRDVVDRIWKMRFVQFFDCWNEYVKSNSTQAFMFIDKEENANAVVLAFRGTELNIADWSTDLDFFYYTIQGIGRVHVGFLEALGLATRLDKETLKQAQDNIIRKASVVAKERAAADLEEPYIKTSGLPESVTKDDAKVIAYDAICDKLRTIMRAHPNAKLFITGHSLGGALAALFSAFLLHENNAAVESRVGGVFTYGQPRVGDASFAKYMEGKLRKQNAPKYFRVVFRSDVVPRVPPEDVVFEFKHVSPCYYYRSIKHCEVLKEEPYKNLLSDMLRIMPHLSALKELLRSLAHTHCSSQGGFFQGLRDYFLPVLAPGICDHSCRRYMAAVKNAPSAFLNQPSPQ